MTEAKPTAGVAVTAPALSFFEFWPMWVFYLPVVALWLALSIRYRSWSLPLIANPAVPLSGMVGVPKSSVFQLAGTHARQYILPWLLLERDDRPVARQVADLRPRLAAAGLALPLVIKPDIGCRGAGVKRVDTEADLGRCLSAYPVGTRLQLQRLAPWTAEAGIFYIREPGRSGGEITSLTLKHTPTVVGDGSRTVGELVAADPRAGQLTHLYQPRNQRHWQRVLAPGEEHRLLFSASHCRGAVFRDAPDGITPALVRALDGIFADIPGFHYGRLDVKFKDEASLRAGKHFAIIEINGASSESINIWDSGASLRSAFATLLRQYRTLFRIGAANRHAGHRPPGMRALYRAWRLEKNLTRRYPPND